MAVKETDENVRILAQDQYITNDTWKSRLNNNDLIIGPSGAGKTRTYVKPNIMQCNESMIIADTKGNLHRQVRPLLEAEGYEVQVLDVKNLKNSCGYNPFDFIRFDAERKAFHEQDILTVAAVLVPINPKKENSYYDMSARMYLSCLIGYSLECRPKAEHNLDSVYRLLIVLGSEPEEFEVMMDRLLLRDGHSFAVRQYHLFKTNRSLPHVHNTILGILGEHLSTLCFSNVVELYTSDNRIDFKKIGKQKTAVFLSISDTDRSLDRLTSLFYIQALQVLVAQADSTPKGKLRVPVRFILDDFATNTYIEGFDNIVSVIRSREIYMSIILQSVTQLNALYGEERAQTIINNFDHCIYLGGQDVVTAQYMSVKSEIPVAEILNMPLDKAFLFRRGSKAQMVERYDIQSHPNYMRIPESELDSITSAPRRPRPDRPRPLSTEERPERPTRPERPVRPERPRVTGEGAERRPPRPDVKPL